MVSVRNVKNCDCNESSNTSKMRFHHQHSEIVSSSNPSYFHGYFDYGLLRIYDRAWFSIFEWSVTQAMTWIMDLSRQRAAHYCKVCKLNGSGNWMLVIQILTVFTLSFIILFSGLKRSNEVWAAQAQARFRVRVQHLDPTNLNFRAQNRPSTTLNLTN